MKLNGFVGKGSGKLGASVFAISGGEQIVRQYNPQVTNPNTDAQVAQRAKLKLMSQLAAVLGPALGFAKQGLVSARNQFVSRNIGLAVYATGEANVNLTALQLTPSSVGFPNVSATSQGEGALFVKLASAPAADIKRVAYFVYRQTSENQLEYVASKIVSEAGAEGTFGTTFNGVSGDLVVYAYGIKDNSAAATLRYENYETEAQDQQATLSVVSLFRTADYGLTATMSTLVAVA